MSEPLIESGKISSESSERGEGQIERERATERERRERIRYRESAEGRGDSFKRENTGLLSFLLNTIVLILF